MKYFFGVIIFVMLTSFSYAIHNADFKNLPFNKDINTQIVYKSNNKVMIKDTQRMSKEIIAGQEYIIIKSFASGKADKDTSFTRKMISYYTTTNGKTSIFAQSLITTIEGKTANTFEIRFYWDKMTASSVFIDYLKGNKKEKSIKLSDKHILSSDIPLYFQDLIAKGVKEDHFTLIVPTGDTINLKAEISYVPENIQGTSCLKIGMKPDFGFISNIIPNVSFWLEEKAPHGFVRYEGPASGPGSPDIIQERL